MVFRYFFKRRSDTSHAHQKRWTKLGSKFVKISVVASFSTRNGQTQEAVTEDEGKEINP
jgi:hypothetical protein